MKRKGKNKKSRQKAVADRAKKMGKSWSDASPF
jgi:hypothetical protein